MAYLATLGRTHASGLAGTEGREVVMMEVALPIDRLDGVETLPLVEHAERGHGEDLGLPTLEEPGAMDERQVVWLHHKGANLGGRTSVDALTALDDHLAHGALLEAFELSWDGTLPLELLLIAELGRDRLLECLDPAYARRLVSVAESSLHLAKVGEHTIVNLLAGPVEEVLPCRDGTVLRLDLGEKRLLLRAEGGDGLLAEGHGGKHVVLRDLLGARLEHRNEGRRPRKLQV